MACRDNKTKPDQTYLFNMSNLKLTWRLRLHVRSENAGLYDYESRHFISRQWV